MMINKNERVLPDMSSAPGAAGAAGAAAAAVASPPVDSGRSKKVQPFPSQRKGKEGVTVNLQSTGFMLVMPSKIINQRGRVKIFMFIYCSCKP